MSYRDLPRPVSDDRDFYWEAEQAAWADSDNIGGDALTWARRVGLWYPEDLGLLAIHIRKSIPRRWPRLADVVHDFLRYVDATRRAAKAPCPNIGKDAA